MIGKTIDRYKIVDKLGEGGMGSVWKAEDTKLNRLVALKTLSPHLAENEEARERFVREAQAASALNHPSITTVYDLLDDDGQHFICMEYVEGKTIRDMVESDRVGVKKAVDITLQATEALGTAHRKGILHRDVKSANIMVSMEGNVKVMDFGLAHLEERSQLTRTGTTMGTLAYSSPEQLTGRPYDERSEIWSLGVVFYELLTGKLPFGSSAEGELVFAIINNEQEHPSTLREDVPEKVEAVVTRMLEKQPELRYEGCGELLNDLNTIRSELETTTVSLSSNTPSASLFQKVRGRLPIVLSAVVVLALVVALTGILKPRSISQPTLAIITFKYLGSDDDSWFAEAISRQIHNGLKSVSTADLFIRPFNPEIFLDAAGYDYQQIGRDLRVDYVLAGSVQRNPKPDGTFSIVLIPDLIRVSDDQAVPGMSQVEVGVDEISELVSIVVGQIKYVLGVTLVAETESAPEEYLSNNSQAQEAFLRASNYIEQGTYPSYLQAVDLYSEAVDLDPQFAAAYAGLAFVFVELGNGHGYGQYPTLEAYELASEALDRAIELAPDASSTHLAQGNYYYRIDKDYERAINEYQIALSKQPNDANTIRRIAFAQRRLGLWDECEKTLLHVLELDSSNNLAAWELFLTYLWMREYENAERLCDYYISLNPTDYFAHERKALLFLLWQGDIPRAWQSLKEVSQDYIEQTLPRSGYYIYERTLIRNLADSLASIQFIRPTSQRWGYYLAKGEVLTTTDTPQHAIAYFDSAAALLLDVVNRQTEAMQRWELDLWGYTQHRAYLGFALAFLNQPEMALQYGQEAVDLFPLELDHFAGVRHLMYLAEIKVITGRYDEALDDLEVILSRPAPFSATLMNIDPRWAPLRDHPRYQALLRKYN